MEEAEFFPGDFNGIVACSPGMYYSHLMLSFLWGLKASTDHATLSPQKLQLLHSAVMEKCDAEDGVKDGLLEDLLSCSFSPKALLCQGSDADSCLTPEEVKTAELIYQGPRNPRTGKELYPGFALGSEASPEFTGPLALGYGWSMIQGRLATQYAVPLLKNMVFGANWNWRTFDFDRDVEQVDRALHQDIDSVNPDLRAFHARNGKLIMIQGWGDPFNAQTFPIEYRNQVIAEFADGVGSQHAKSIVDGFFRLFMSPGMGHCIGGPGPSATDALGAVRAWVETGMAPDRLVAQKVSFFGAPSSPAISRPLCPYPETAQWTHHGSTNDASNFACAMPNASQ